jgi:hypothetical protein
MRPEQVHKEKHVEEHALRSDSQKALEPIGFRQMREGHEVGALVLRFVQQRLDPAPVVFEAP